MSNGHEQGRRAIEVHSEQAELFSHRYESLVADPYASCFAYSRHRLQVLLERLLPAPGGPAALLDVGCGTGHHLAWALNRGFVATGVDGSEAMLLEARKLNPRVDVRLAEVQALPFAESEFDTLLCIEVLRYLPDIAPCVRELARVLKPGGCCLATASPLFNMNGFPLLNRLALHTQVIRAVRLKQYFHTAIGLKRGFRRAGFQHVTVHGVYLAPGNWIERIAPGLLPGFLRRFEPWDAALCNKPVLRELSGMLLVHATR